ncbi:MAG: class I SAM-dependent methyltransferase [Candidatus Omnitrophica bacterium]|nr:class I SAM-dependent methyltransferase [Candidatus Omnitrophota bacterium]
MPSLASVESETSSRYGYLWSASQRRQGTLPPAYHFDRMREGLHLAPLKGLVLDAGCGNGIDLYLQAVRHPQAQLVGVELSPGGSQASFARTRSLSNARILQADIQRLPFGPGCFDFIYSYGVLHHMASPLGGLQELVHLAKPGAALAIYLYEDMSDRSVSWRLGLKLTRLTRGITRRLPPGLLYGLCVLGSPLAWLTFTLPYRLAKDVRVLSSWVKRLPYRHGQGPLSLVGDLYDRFSAPLEHRFSREGAIRLMGQAGLGQIRVAYDRGWMLAGVKPVEAAG